MSRSLALVSVAVLVNVANQTSAWTTAAAILACSEVEACRPHSKGGNLCVDLSCSSDVDCDSSEYCADDGLCSPDVCSQSTQSCDDNSLMLCSPTGSEERAVACASEAYFTSTCENLSTAYCSCEDDWDCPAYMVCETGACVGTGLAPSCTLPPTPFADTPPEVEILWGGASRSNSAAFDGTGAVAPWPMYSHVIGTPAVANLDDDNGDGLINELDFPEILFVGYEGDISGAPGGTNDWKQDGVVRAIHGGGPQKGKDFFARCGDALWVEGDMLPTGCNNDGNSSGGAGDAVGGSGVAVADLDYDGVPEIIYVRENDSLRILNNVGETLVVTPPTTWSTKQDAETISVANLDYEGNAEIIVGRTVLKLDHDVDGELFVSHILEGTQTRGINGFGPMSCVADVHPSPGQEIAAGTTLYRLPDTLPTCGTAPCKGALTQVWRASTVQANIDGGKLPSNAEGFCAIANVWGSEFSVSPGPNNHPDDDGRPEVILIANGNLIILDGATGEVISQRNLGGGEDGGAPNVDDFDGDGFMEIASALQDFYVVVDLQDPTSDSQFNTVGACPAWPDPLTRAVNDDGDPSVYNPNLLASGNTENVAKPRLASGSCMSNDDCGTGTVCGTNNTCVCLHNGWRRGSDDASSRATSSSVFDFNGDGAAEVIYNDECEMRVYDGSNGRVLSHEISRSRTAIENPIVADVDNDGNAEIVTVLNTEANDRCDDDAGDTAGPNGLRVWGDPTDTWVSARRIWNQQSYHVTNITESGQVPMHPPESWGMFGGRVYNTYRSQPRNYGVAPDLVVAGLNFSSPDAACGTLSERLDIGFQVENQGDLRVGPGVTVAFYGNWNGEEVLLLDGAGKSLLYTIGQSLEPGSSLIDSVAYNSEDQTGKSGLPDSIRVVVDPPVDQGAPTGGERECVEDNNDLSSPVEAGETRADLVAHAHDASIACSEGRTSLSFSVENQGTKSAKDITIVIYAGDPSQGGQAVHTDTISKKLDPGASVDMTATFSSRGTERSVLWLVVNPLGTIEECNSTNNRDPAENLVPACMVLTR